MTETPMQSGGCHCGQVRFEVKAGLEKVIACNCSICQKAGYMLTFVPAQDFTLLKGDDALTDYQFNKTVIHHVFCRVCGIHAFARGTDPSGAQMIAVNIRCLDGVDAASVSAHPFDGKSL